MAIITGQIAVPSVKVPLGNAIKPGLKCKKRCTAVHLDPVKKSQPYVAAMEPFKERIARLPQKGSEFRAGQKISAKLRGRMCPAIFEEMYHGFCVVVWCDRNAYRSILPLTNVVHFKRNPPKKVPQNGMENQDKKVGELGKVYTAATKLATHKKVALQVSKKKYSGIREEFCQEWMKKLGESSAKAVN